MRTVRCCAPSRPLSDEETDSTESWRYSYIDTILSDDNGYVYTYDYQTVNVYGPDGSFVFSKSGDELNGQICGCPPARSA